VGKSKNYRLLLPHRQIEDRLGDSNNSRVDNSTAPTFGQKEAIKEAQQLERSATTQKS